MKRLLYILCFMTSLSSIAQTYPVENVSLLDKDRDIKLQGITHVKDINGALNKFIGTWKGIKDGKTYEFKITKITDVLPDGMLWDMLVLRYKITGQKGVLEDTMAAKDNEYPITKSLRHFENIHTYSFDFIGKDTACGANGALDFTSQNNSKMKVQYYRLGRKHYTCQIPLYSLFWEMGNITLTKQ